MAAALEDSATVVRALGPGEGKGLKALPGTTGSFLLGETLQYTGDVKGFLRERLAKHGPVFLSSILFKPTVVIADPRIMKPLLLKEGNWIQSQWPAPTRYLLGNGALTVQQGEVHKKQRKFMHDAALGQDEVVRQLEVFARASERHLAKWIRACEEAPFVQVYPLLKHYTFDMACEVVLGEPLQDQVVENLMVHFKNYIEGLFAVPIPLPGFAFYKAIQGRKAIQTAIKAKADEIKARVRAETEVPDADAPMGILERLIRTTDEEGKPAFEDSVLLDQALLLLFAGHDTTATTTTALIMLIPYKAGLMDRLRDEQRAVVAEHGTGMTPATLKAMPLLDATINEALRTVVPISGTFRITKTDLQIGNYRVPKGYQLLFSLTGSHALDENDMEKPCLMRWKEDVLDRFNPDVWGNGTNPFLLTFSHGTRRCLGYNFALAELKVKMATLLRSCTWSLIGGTELHEWVVFPVPKPKDGLHIHFEANPI